MTPYLQQVATRYFEQGGISDRVFIFPNRRSLVFFRKYLGECIAPGEKPILAPVMLTVNDFFSRVTGQSSSDRITLLLKLYESYRKLNPKAEPLDDFVYWGDVLLADFDDVDKYRVDARMLFSDISDIKSISDNFEYATPTQLEAIKKLADHFAPGGKRSSAKDSFLLLWKILYPLYNDFRKALVESGCAYEGMVYRRLADSLDSSSVADVMEEAFPGAAGFVFVGLNALNECERAVLRKMDKAGIAEFTFDYAGTLVTAEGNGSTHFMERNRSDFEHIWIPELPQPNIPAVHVCGVPSATGQAKIIQSLLKAVPDVERALDCAVVLADETMLMPVLNSLPECEEGVNVTMGYPLAASEFMSFMRDVAALQIHARVKGGAVYFYHRQVSDIFSSSMIRGFLSEEEKAAIADVTKAAKYYVPESDLRKGRLFDCIFRPAGDLAGYLKEVTTCVSEMVGDQDSLQVEFAKHYYCCVNRLSDLGYELLPKTWIHLLEQLVSGVSVPFEGEPLGGLQVMGPLETRALDFKHIFILNSNEGVFPRASISPSFVPPELRRGFALPTYEYQDDVWAYYFYRLITRAQNVWMVYDSRTEGMNTGEESRYIKQLRYIYGDKVKLTVAAAHSEIRTAELSDKIEKTAEDMEKIKATVWSASLVQSYLTCPMKFYYSHIKQLPVSSEVNESLDNAMIGTVCHDTMQYIYQLPDKDTPLEVSESYIEGWIANKARIRAKIESLVAGALNTIEITGRDLVSVDIIQRFVLKVLDEDLRLVREHGTMFINAVESDMRADICGHKFKGRVDRIDSFGDGAIRIVDYKSGSDDPNQLKQGTKAIPKSFITSGINDCKAAIQFFVYDRMVMADPMGEGKLINNSMYAMKDIFSNEVAIYPFSAENDAKIEAGLNEFFSVIENPAVPFERADAYNAKCGWCDFRIICGRDKKS